MPDQDVTADPSAAPADDLTTPATDQAPSAPVAEVVDDRPLKNVTAEFNRKLGKVESRIDELVALLQQPRQPTQAAAPAGLDQYSDDQLRELYRAGSLDAGLELQQRTNKRQMDAYTAQQHRAQLVTAQVQTLYARYPQLSDPSDPLTQAAVEAKGVLMRRGSPPTQETDLEAIKYAILDNPHLVKSASAPASPQTTRVPASAQIDGATPRRPAPARSSVPGVNPKAQEIARRMGVKDPAKAMQKFEERQKAGRSAVSPMVATIIREEG